MPVIHTTPQGGSFPSLRELQDAKAGIESSHSQRDVVYLGDVKPVDVWLNHMNRIFYGVLGSGLYDFFSTTVSEDPRTGFSVAQCFHRHLRKQKEVPAELIVHEYGIGNGNFSAAFLHRMGELDRENGTDFLKRTRMVMCDFSDEILKAVEQNTFLMQFKENIVLAKVDAVTLKPEKPEHERYFRPGCVHQMFSNELADTLNAKIIVIEGGNLYEGHVRPFIRKDALRRLRINDADSFRMEYNAGNLTALRSYPRFFDEIDVEMIGLPLDPRKIPDWELAKQLLPGLENQDMAVNYGFHQHLKAVALLMNRECGRGYDIFDTGYLNIKRSHGSQLIPTQGDYCFAVNFPLASLYSRSIGLGVDEPETQKGFVSREIAPACFLLDIVETHPVFKRMDREGQGELLRAVAREINPHYDNVLFRWFAREQMINMRSRRGVEGVLDEGLFRFAYDQARREGYVGIRHQHHLVTHAEVDAAMEGLERLGFRRESIQQAYKDPDSTYTCYGHMHVTPA